MISYLKYLAKKRIPVLVALSVIAVITCFISTATSNLVEEYILYTESGQAIHTYRAAGTPLLVFSVLISAMCVIVPMFEFSFKMNKLSCNQAYSFPIKRWQLYLSHFIIGYAMIIISFTLGYFVSLLDIACRFNMFETRYFFAYYPLILLAGIPMYSIVCFIYCETNSVVDGIITVAFWCIIGMILVADLYYFKIKAINEIWDYSLFQPANVITTIFQYNLNGKNIYYDYGSLDFYLSFAIVIALGIAAMIGFPFRSMHYKAEDTMQKSTSFFSYRVLIPFGAISLALNNTSNFIPFIFAFAGTYLGYALYQRSFKLNKRHWIITGSLLGIVTAVSIIMSFVD